MKRPSRPFRIALVLICVFASLAAQPAQAHFNLNLNVRILHVEHLADGLRVRLRTPMPYVVASLVGPMGEDGLAAAAPFTTTAIEDGAQVHYVDLERVRSDPEGLAALAGESFRIEANGVPLAFEAESLRLHRVGEEPSFATREEAREALESGPSAPEADEPIYVGDAVVDVVLRFVSNGPVREYRLAGAVDPGLPAQEDTANVILDHGPGGTQIFRARGVLDEPVEISRSALDAALTFVEEGVVHILGGLDHVLFVVCLVLGARRLRALVWRATGFTIGHSLTLTLGFFGFVPSGAWFVPAIETGIALSIIWAAAAAVAPSSAARSEPAMFGLTSAIGLLHGLGFSFVLHEILSVDSPDLWQSLLAFNVGVEVGQIAVIALVWPAFALLDHASASGGRAVRMGVAGICIALASVWVVERVGGVAVF